MVEFDVRNTATIWERLRDILAATSKNLSHSRQRKKTCRHLVCRKGVRLYRLQPRSCRLCVEEIHRTAGKCIGCWFDRFKWHEENHDQICGSRQCMVNTWRSNCCAQYTKSVDTLNPYLADILHWPTLPTVAEQTNAFQWVQTVSVAPYFTDVQGHVSPTDGRNEIILFFPTISLV